MSFAETYVSVQTEYAGSKKASTRRSELEIRMDVLQVVSQGIDRPTQIMYKANLSWVALQANLKSLVERALLREDSTGARRRYELTQPGYEVLRTFQKVLEVMGAAPPVKKQFAY
jgi:predicted transcriptional regulator